MIFQMSVDSLNCLANGNLFRKSFPTLRLCRMLCVCFLGAVLVFQVSNEGLWSTWSWHLCTMIHMSLIWFFCMWTSKFCSTTFWRSWLLLGIFMFGSSILWFLCQHHIYIYYSIYDIYYYRFIYTIYNTHYYIWYLYFTIYNILL